MIFREENRRELGLTGIPRRRKLRRPCHKHRSVCSSVLMKEKRELLGDCSVLQALDVPSVKSAGILLKKSIDWSPELPLGAFIPREEEEGEKRRRKSTRLVFCEDWANVELGLGRGARAWAWSY